VLRAQVGSRDALEALFRAIQEPLYRYVGGLVGNRALAEDVVQEVLVRIYRNLGDLREPALFRPWCYRIATREAFRQLRHEQRWSELLLRQAALEDVEALPAEVPTESGLLACPPELLTNVSPSSQAVLALHYLNGLAAGGP
jgi:RNA polymerase sigma-70 factor, ECF subfamily